MDIQPDNLSHPKVISLLQEHLADMHATSPPESIHALDLNSLRQPNVNFWSVWKDEDLLGCGALKLLSTKHGEIKSMRTAREHLRKGVAAKMLKHMIEFAQGQGMQRLSLETGSQEYFYPAHKLYKCFGFEYCQPFADYIDDPNSKYMTLVLGPTR